MSDRLQEIEARLREDYPHPIWYDGQAAEDVPWLLAELASARAQLEQRDDALASDEAIALLALHALTEIRCDHDARTDVAICNCGKWKSDPLPSVQAAKEAWARHVLDRLLALSETGQGESVRDRQRLYTHTFNEGTPSLRGEICPEHGHHYGLCPRRCIVSPAAVPAARTPEGTTSRYDRFPPPMKSQRGDSR